MNNQDTPHRNIWERMNKTLEKKHEIISGLMDNINGNKQQADPPQDKLFKNSAWEENPYYKMVKDAYCQSRESIFENINNVKDPEIKTKLNFMMRTLFDALHPTNFPALNPDVQEATLREKGENLQRGLQLWLERQKEGVEYIPSQVDKKAFTLGKNIAATPGHVIYKNELIELIYYKPTREMNHINPLVICPPWINKYYIFDLSEKNSMVRWCLDQGMAVYIISWVNPQAKSNKEGFDDYVTDGIIKALDVVASLHPGKGMNTLGYCVGGVGLTAALGYLSKKPLNLPILSATLLATPIDFSFMDELKIFVNKDHIELIRNYMKDYGYLPSYYMSSVFNWLRSREMIWNNFINQYYLGKPPPALDVLYWNEDGVNLSGAMHLEYIRRFFHDNEFMNPEGFKVRGKACHLNLIEYPVMMVGTKKDHIVPWYASLGGIKAFKNHTYILGDSGHVAGIINPPHQNKYGYWKLDPRLEEEGLGEDQKIEGSWWKGWFEWIQPHLGEKNHAFQVPLGLIKGEAPGEYVRK